MDEGDRISSLPDCLLHQILSSLTTQESVRTSVLSKRWIHIWKSVPFLDLNSSHFNDSKSFKDFVTSILNHKLFPNPEKLDTFILRCITHCKGHFKTWMSNLVSLKPRKVHIHLYYTYMIYMVHCLFDCSTLETMVLTSRTEDYFHRVYMNPAVINLPRLKILNLHHRHVDDEFIQSLMLGCPVLEKLVLEYCLFNVTETISSSSLKILRIRYNNFEWDSILRISMPGLVDLDYGCRSEQICFENLASLECAKVELRIGKNYDGQRDKLLRGLSNAKSLQLHGDFYVELQKGLKDLPIFRNLKILDIGFFLIGDNFEPIASFLRCTPNLEKLALRYLSVREENFLQWKNLNETPCDNLKTLEIYSNNNQMASVLAKYLCKNYKAIKNVKINSDYYDLDFDNLNFDDLEIL